MLSITISITNAKDNQYSNSYNNNQIAVIYTTTLTEVAKYQRII